MTRVNISPKSANKKHCNINCNSPHPPSLAYNKTITNRQKRPFPNYNCKTDWLIKEIDQYSKATFSNCLCCHTKFCIVRCSFFINHHQTVVLLVIRWTHLNRPIKPSMTVILVRTLNYRYYCVAGHLDTKTSTQNLKNILKNIYIINIFV